MRSIPLVLVLVLVACKSADAPPNPQPTDDPVKCASDQDCTAGACGPCGSGDVITSKVLMQECVTNPCAIFDGPDGSMRPMPTAMCKDHVCVIR